MNVVDLGLALARVTEAPPAATTVSALLVADGRAYTLLSVPVGARWEAPAGASMAALVLAGIGTREATGARESLGPGHLAVAEAGRTLSVDNDGGEPIVALLMASEADAVDGVQAAPSGDEGAVEAGPEGGCAGSDDGG